MDITVFLSDYETLAFRKSLTGRYNINISESNNFIGEVWENLFNHKKISIKRTANNTVIGIWSTNYRIEFVH